MRKVFSFIFVLMLLVLSLRGTALAQGIITPTPGPGVVLADAQAGTPQAANPNAITFAQIYGGEIQLHGPYDSNTKTFGLPADWQLSEPAQLNLNMTIALNATLSGDVNAAGGVLTITFNRNTIATLPIMQTGIINQTLTISTADLVSVRSDGRMEIGLVLDSGVSCTVNQQVSIFVHPNSQIIFPHDNVVPKADLSRFPFPLFQDTVMPESALVVIPDQPTAGEIQSALTVAAGLSNLTSNALTLDMITFGQLTDEIKNANNLVFVGQVANLPLLDQLQLPLMPTAGALNLNGAEDGVVELTNSVWNAAKVILVVSGNSDAGVVKAAQALSTGNLRPFSVPNLAVVQEIQQGSAPTSIPVTQTLADLGYTTDTIARNTTASSGVTTTLSYKFYVPTGQTTTEDAYFELAFGQSALANYERSAAVILLNSQPIGSIRFSDTYAANSVNKLKFALPASGIVNGFNRVDIQVSLFPRDTCTVPSVKGLWFSVWAAESSFYLPLTPYVISPVTAMDLSAYPAPFIFDAKLGSTAFVLQNNNLDAWRAAFKIAAYLGDRANGTITTLKVFYGDNVPEAERAGYNWIVIGQPSQMPIVVEFNDKLPAPFENDLANESSLQVTYRIPPDAPQGYIELLQSPWNPDHLVVTLLGNTLQGVNWASNALIDSTLRSQLAGNFAVINDLQVDTADTRTTVLSPSTLPPNQDGDTSPQQLVPNAIDLTPPPANRPGWLLQAMLFSGGAAIFIVLAVIATSLLRNRYRGK